MMGDFRMLALLHEEDMDTITHVACGVAGYATLCGCSSDDDQAEEVLNERTTVDCAACYMLWKTAQGLTKINFDPELRRNDG